MGSLRKLFVYCLFMALVASCQKNDSVSSLYKFSSLTKDVHVQISIDYKVDVTGGPSVQVEDQSFILNAFLADDEQLQVQVAKDGVGSTFDLPVVLSGTQLVFDAVLRIPVDTQPGADGYTFFFALKEQNTSLWSLITNNEVESNTVKNLEALKGGVQPGAAPSTNAVSLSLATSIAYRIAKESGVSGASLSGLQAYEKLLSVVNERLRAVEGKMDSAANPDLETYASAVLAGLKYEILRDQDLQADMTGILNDAIAPAADGLGESTDGPGKTENDLVKTLTETLKGFAETVKTTLGTDATAESKLFKSGEVKPEVAAEISTYTNVAFAPTFTFTDEDTDTTLKGRLALNAPKYASGADSYNIYFGGDGQDTAARKLKLLGKLSATADSLSLELPDQTVVPNGATRFWLFIEKKGTELSASSSLAIKNLIKQDAPTIQIQSPTVSNAGWTNTAQVNITVGNDSTAAAWCLIEDSTSKPTVSKCGSGSWLTARPTTFTFVKGDGARKIYAWLKFRDDVISPSAQASIQVDTVAPIISVTSPAAMAFVGPNAQVTVQCEVGTRLSFDLDGGASQQLDCTNASTALTPGWSTPDGNKAFNAKSVDKAGNESSTTRTFVYDATAPTDGSVSAPAAAVTIMGASYDLTWTAASDAGSGLAATPYIVTAHTGNDCSAAATSTAEVSGLTQQVTAIADASTTSFKIRSKDAVGNTSSGICAAAITRRATPPPTVIGDSTSGTFDTTSRDVPLSVTGLPSGWHLCASSTQSTAPTADTCGGSGWVTTAPTVVSLPNAEDTYTIYVWFKAPDGVLATSVSRVVWLNLNAPSVSFVTPSDNSHQKATMSVTVSCETGTPVTFSGSVEAKTVDCTASQATTTLTTTGPDGAKSVTATQTDNHSRSDSDTINFTRDSVAPTLSITSPAANQLSELNGTISLEIVCEGGINVVIGGHAAAETVACPSPADTLTKTIYLMEPDGNRTISITQTDLAGNVTTATRTFERFFGRIMTRNVMVEPDTPRQFYMGISSANPDNWVYSLDEDTDAVTSLVTANGEISVSGYNFTYTPANNFVGTEVVRVYAKNPQGKKIWGDVQFEVDNTISTVQPVLSVRGTGCMMCHARINASMITDFGYGSPYYGGGNPTVHGNFTAGNFYGDHAENWETARITGQIIVPTPVADAALPGQGTLTPLTYFRGRAGRSYGLQSNVIERDNIYIGAPTVQRLRELTGLHPGDVVHTTFFKSEASSPGLSGLLHNEDGDYYYNDPDTSFRCYGDLAVDGLVYLRNLKLETDNAGCRIYATQSIFVDGPIVYDRLPVESTSELDASNPDRHLQLSSAQSINLGLGSIKVPSEGAGNCNSGATVDGKATSVLARYQHGNESKTMHTRVTGKDLDATHANNLEIIAQSERIGILRDAECHHPSTSFERILINAPLVMSRYKGNVKGMVVAEVALFALGNFEFSYDTVFDGKSLLPLLSRADWIRIGEKSESAVSTITTIQVGAFEDQDDESESLKSLTPSFHRDTLNYSTYVWNPETVVRFRTWSDHPDTAVTVNGSPATWSEFSGAVPLSVGPNVIEVEGVSMDEQQSTTYTFTVHRMPPNNDASLYNLTVSAGTLSPAFDPDVFNYTVNVGNDVTTIRVTPTLLAVIKDYYIEQQDYYDGQGNLHHLWRGSGQQSDPVNLNVGNNTLTIKVRAEDNVTFETYTVTVVRAAGS